MVVLGTIIAVRFHTSYVGAHIIKSTYSLFMSHKQKKRNEMSPPVDLEQNGAPALLYERCRSALGSHVRVACSVGVFVVRSASMAKKRVLWSTCVALHLGHRESTARKIA